LPYAYGFGVDQQNPTEIDLDEPFALFEIMRELGIGFVNVTLASPYYNPHVTRPAIYPPSDGYFPPEDPLIGVMRHIDVVRRLKQRFPDFCLMGSGYTYLQEYFPHVAQAVIRMGYADLIGLGRMMLAYPELPRDILEGRPIQKKRFCRTFSDCTTAPRNGLVSGCYPLDGHYKGSAEAKTLAAIKKPAKIA
jgi:2,4-dienoyl-CoA reductase-like NADH-dependent reductase (Old Yellow Enzyme family)